jgi:hypothetical protein
MAIKIQPSSGSFKPILYPDKNLTKFHETQLKKLVKSKKYLKKTKIIASNHQTRQPQKPANPHLAITSAKSFPTSSQHREMSPHRKKPFSQLKSISRFSLTRMRMKSENSNNAPTNEIRLLP